MKTAKVNILSALQSWLRGDCFEKNQEILGRIVLPMRLYLAMVNL